MKNKRINIKSLILLVLIGLLAAAFFTRTSTALAVPRREPSDAPPHIDRRIQASSDDARQTGLAGGTLSLTAQNLFMGDFGSTPQYIGLRFANLVIPQGATITHAFLTFTAFEDSHGSTTLLINAHSSDHSPTFSEGNGPLDRQGELSSAQVAWSPEDWDDGYLYASADISTIIQEIIDRPGWYAGNAISLIISDGDGINNIIRKFVAWDLDPSHATELTIAFTEPPSAQQGPVLAECEDNFIFPQWLRQTFPFLLSDDSTTCSTKFEDPAGEPGEGRISGPEPVLCLASPECMFSSGLAGLVMLVVGGVFGWRIANRMGFLKAGKAFIALVSAIMFCSFSALVVGGVISAWMRQSGEITPSEVSSDSMQVIEEDVHLCGTYFKTYADTVTNKIGEIEDILIFITVPGDVTLPQDSRFRVIVKDNLGNPREIVTNNNSVSLSAAGLFPDQIDSPLIWQVVIEYLAAPGGDLFLAFCSAEEMHEYDFEILEESQIIITPTSTSSATSTPEQQTAPAEMSSTATTPPKADDTLAPTVRGANADPNPTLTTFPVTISATISDESGVAWANLYFKTGKGAYQVAGSMSSIGGDVYSKTIGPLTPAGTYIFRILAVDNQGLCNCCPPAVQDDCPGGSFVVDIP